MKKKNLAFSILIILAMVFGLSPLVPDVQARGKSKHYKKNEKHHGRPEHIYRYEDDSDCGHHKEVKYSHPGRKKGHYKKAKHGHGHYKKARHDCRHHNHCQHKEAVYVERKVYKPVYVPSRRTGGEIVISIPIGSVRIVIRGGVYHHHDGVYYKKIRNSYMVVKSPSGAYRNVLPPYARAIHYKSDRYWESEGLYYHKYNSGYLVSEKPFYALHQPATDRSESNQMLYAVRW